jgi:hypothetical protein
LLQQQQWNRNSSWIAALAFLSTAQAELLNEVLARRNSPLSERIRQASVVSRPDAEEIVTVLSDELADNLDADWEPTDYGRTVSTVQCSQYQRMALSERNLRDATSVEAVMTTGSTTAFIP